LKHTLIGISLIAANSFAQTGNFDCEKATSAIEKGNCAASKLSALAELTHATSFNCPDANTSVEKAICSNSQLSDFDRKLKEIYKRAIRVSPIPDSLMVEQGYWLRDIRNECFTTNEEGNRIVDIPGMQNAYADRIRILDGIINPTTDATRLSVKSVFEDLYEACNTYYSLYPEGIICNHDRKFKRRYEVSYRYNGLEGLAVLDFIPRNKFKVNYQGDVIPPDDSYVTENGFVDGRHAPIPNLIRQTNSQPSQYVTQLAHHSASFDCTIALTQIEKLICTSSEVSELDNHLAQSYMNARSISNLAKSIRYEQRAWVINVRDKCQNILCLHQAYISRIEFLDKTVNEAITKETSKIGLPFAK